jgi:hypothetical protein
VAFAVAQVSRREEEQAFAQELRHFTNAESTKTFQTLRQRTKCLKPCSKDYSLKAKWLARFPGSAIPWLFAGDLVPITLPEKL